MTLIARVVAGNTPILFGDLLVSSQAGSPVYLPTVGALYPAPPGRFPQPSALTQKVALLGDRCVVAWAGSYAAARQAIRELRELAGADRLDFERLEAFVRAMDDSGSSKVERELSLIGLHFDPSGGHRGFSKNALSVRVHGLDEVTLAGSGANHVTIDEHGVTRYFVVEALQQASALIEAQGVRSNAMAATLLLQSQLLMAELGTRETVEYLYGGGYESAYLGDDQRFRKVDEPVYVYGDVELDPRATPDAIWMSMPRRCSRSVYHGSTLLVLNADFEYSGSNEVTKQEIRVHALTDILDDPAAKVDMPSWIRTPEGIHSAFDAPRVIAWNLIVRFRGRPVASLILLSLAQDGVPHEFVRIRRDHQQFAIAVNAGEAMERFGSQLMRLKGELRERFGAHPPNDVPQ